MEQHHALFRQIVGLKGDEWGLRAHESMATVLDLAGTYDQLDLTNCAFAESAGFSPEFAKPGLLQPSSVQPGRTCGDQHACHGAHLLGLRTPR